MARGAYEWRITIPGDGMLICAGLLPTLIQWDCATHPADNLEDCGCELVALAGSHPAPAGIAPALRSLGVDALIELSTAEPALTAYIRGPRGLRAITS